MLGVRIWNELKHACFILYRAVASRTTGYKLQPKDIVGACEYEAIRGALDFGRGRKPQANNSFVAYLSQVDYNCLEPRKDSICYKLSSDLYKKLESTVDVGGHLVEIIIMPDSNMTVGQCCVESFDNPDLCIAGVGGFAGEWSDSQVNSSAPTEEFEDDQDFFCAPTRENKPKQESFSAEADQHLEPESSCAVGENQQGGAFVTAEMPHSGLDFDLDAEEIPISESDFEFDSNPVMSAPSGGTKVMESREFKARLSVASDCGADYAVYPGFTVGVKRKGANPSIALDSNLDRVSGIHGQFSCNAGEWAFQRCGRNFAHIDGKSLGKGEVAGLQDGSVISFPGIDLVFSKASA